MDIKVVIKKGLAYFISVLVLLFLYIYLLFVLKDYLVNEFGYSEQTILIALVLIIVLTFEPLRRNIIKLVDKVLFFEQEESKHQVENLKLTLSSAMHFDQLINKIKLSVQSFLNINDINFIWLNKEIGKLENYKGNEKIVLETTGPIFQYLKNNPEVLVTEEIPYLIEQMSNGEKELLIKVEKKLKDLNVYLVMPIGEQGELIGIFLLTQKKNKEAFTTEDVEYLIKMQPQMTGAIANAIFYKQAVERIGRL